MNIKKTDVFTQRIRDEAKKLKEDLYGKDFNQMHTRVIDFLNRREAEFKNADSWLDNKLIDIACSKYTLLIVASIIFSAVGVGVLL